MPTHKGTDTSVCVCVCVCVCVYKVVGSRTAMVPGYGL